MKNIDYVKNRMKYLIIPIVVIVAGIIMFVVKGGFNFDIEFMGGVRMQVDMENESNTDVDRIKTVIKDGTGVDAIVQRSGTGTHVLIKTPHIEDDVKDKVFTSLKEEFSLNADEAMSVATATPNFGRQVQQKTLLYTIIAIILILIYIAFRFEWSSAVMAVVSLVINILIMFSVYAITYLPLNTTFIAAMLTVVGYSINNTIVVFDRIREDMKTARSKSVAEIVNSSIAATMGRTINTTVTTLITIVLLYIIGVASIKEFALPLIVGVFAGAYSSIFIAGTFWAIWKEKQRALKREKAGKGGKGKKRN
ncbi:MAG: protein translocase subunit SecF [Oscillospiraceae bacterium]|nr:protein translocase subunit SecF [Oscillospiraceae bacterium]